MFLTARKFYHSRATRASALTCPDPAARLILSAQKPCLTTQKHRNRRCDRGKRRAFWRKKRSRCLKTDPRVARIHLVVTETGQRLFSEELGITAGDLKQLPSRILGRAAKKIEVHFQQRHRRVDRLGQLRKWMP